MMNPTPPIPPTPPSAAHFPADAAQDYSSADYRPGPAIRWGLPQFAIGLGAFVVIIVAVNVLALFLPTDAQGPLLFAAVLAGYGALFVTTLLASRRRGTGSLGRDFGLRFRPVDLAIGLGVGIAAKIAGAVVAVPLVGLTGGVPTSNVPAQNDLVWIVLNTVVATTLVAPVVEELFFRGLLLRAIRNGLLRGRAAHPRADPPDARRVRRALLGSVLISSAVFMLVHLYQAPDLTTLLVLGSSTLLLGLANAVLATRTGRLGPGIVAHMVFNGVTVLGFLASVR
jgi:membrane protease YdiL (CAAX protease family)